MKYHTRQRAAEYLTEKGIPTTEQALADRARRGNGPRYGMVGFRAVYTASDLDAWVTEQLARPVARRPRRQRQSDTAAA